MKTYKLLCVLAFISIIFCTFIMCNSSGDSEEISRDLANRMTDSLNLDGGEITSSDVPDYNQSADFPQITTLTGPDLLPLKAGFSVNIGLQQTASLEVEEVMVWVENAAKYIRVTLGESMANPKIYLATIQNLNSITITGTMGYDEELIGKTFDIYVAIFGEDNTTGERKKWTVTVVNPVEDGDLDEETEIPTNDGDDDINEKDNDEIITDGDQEESDNDLDIVEADHENEENMIDGDDDVIENDNYDTEAENEKIEIEEDSIENTVDGDLDSTEAVEIVDRELIDNTVYTLFSVSDNFGCTRDDTPVNCVATDMNDLRPIFTELDDRSSIKKCRDTCEREGGETQQCIANCQNAIISKAKQELWDICYGCILFAYNEDTQDYKAGINDLTRSEAREYADKTYKQIANGTMILSTTTEDVP